MTEEELVKLKKVDLVDRVLSLQEKVKALGLERYENESKLEKFEEDRKYQDQLNGVLNGKLASVRSAIETYTAIKFPNEQLTKEHHGYNYDQLDGVQNKPNDSEELMFLRLIYGKAYN